MQWPPMGRKTVQLVLPMAEMVGWLRKGVGELIRQAGLQLMEPMMEEEVRELVGERSAAAGADGQPVGQGARLLRGDGTEGAGPAPRVRTTEDQEVRLGSYEMFHRGEPLTETVWEKLMLGLSTRKYGQSVRRVSSSRPTGWRKAPSVSTSSKRAERS